MGHGSPLCSSRSCFSQDDAVQKEPRMNFLGIPLWERRVNGFQKPVRNGWSSLPVPSEEPAPVVPRSIPPVRSQGTLWLQIILFLITVATTLLAGMYWAESKAPLQHLEQQ